MKLKIQDIYPTLQCALKLKFIVVPSRITGSSKPHYHATGRKIAQDVWLLRIFICFASRIPLHDLLYV